MPSPKKPKSAPAAKDSPAAVLLAGVVCLAAGLGIGYYFGRQAADDPAAMPAAALPPAEPGPVGVPDPKAFMQEESRLKALASANSRDLDALIRLGNLYYDGGRFREAIDWYGRALDIDPNNPGVRTDRGTCYWSLGDPESALAEFEKTLALNPTHPQTLYNIGVVQLHGKNDVAEARKAWEKLLATSPDYPDRSRVQEQLKVLSSMPAQGAAAPASSTQSSSDNLQNLLERMKKKP